MIIAIIQSRMGSSRLPGKVMKKIDNKILMEYQLDRVLASKRIDKVVIATSILKQDDVIENFCNDYGIECFRGSENDVLSRYYECAKYYKADIIVRLTADCPLVDPLIIDKVIDKFKEDNVDYCGNTVPLETNTFPDGTDTEVFSMESLSKAYKEIKDFHFREHVTFQFWQNKEYSKTQLFNEKNYSDYRITVDYPEDFEVVSFIFRELKKRESFGHLDEIIEILNSNPDVKKKNDKYYFGQGWKK
ncbi:glycosyltransferase family protein [Arcobacter sp. KX21116]|uniref:cytidylyltransferase domain-containing protein n=1 Tax=Arcobacter iocasae TaxID=2906515 RepID=UPI0035D4B6E6